MVNNDNIQECEMKRFTINLSSYNYYKNNNFNYFFDIKEQIENIISEYNNEFKCTKIELDYEILSKYRNRLDIILTHISTVEINENIKPLYELLKDKNSEISKFLIDHDICVNIDEKFITYKGNRFNKKIINYAENGSICAYYSFISNINYKELHGSCIYSCPELLQNISNIIFEKQNDSLILDWNENHKNIYAYYLKCPVNCLIGPATSNNIETVLKNIIYCYNNILKNRFYICDDSYCQIKNEFFKSASIIGKIKLN